MDVHGAGNSPPPVFPAAPASGAPDPFAALDAGNRNGPMSWTSAGPRHAEAGFADPALGWVAVRADLHNGNVHAAVVAESADSATALGRELTGLSAHLEQRQIPVESIAMAAASGNEMTFGHALQHDARQGGGSDTQSANAPIQDLRIARPVAENKEEAGSAGSMDLFAPRWDATGTRVSVTV